MGYVLLHFIHICSSFFNKILRCFSNAEQSKNTKLLVSHCTQEGCNAVHIYVSLAIESRHDSLPKSGTFPR